MVLQRDRIQFSVCGFDQSSCITLQTGLSRLGVNSVLREYHGKRYLEVNADNSTKLAKQISPYICGCMRYKLPQEFREYPTFSPPTQQNTEVFYTIPVTITKVVRTKHHRPVTTKYDLQTATHNYFANGVLVHNCTTMYTHHIHARSIDSANHWTRDWVKNFWASISHNIPTDWRICGENVFATHSVAYKDLDHYFLGFSIWNEDNICLSWQETVEWFDLLGISPVPVLYEGEYNEDLICTIWSQMSPEHHEGYVVRYADSFQAHDFTRCVGKFVRPYHVQTSEHWMHGVILQNGLRSN